MGKKHIAVRPAFSEIAGCDHIEAGQERRNGARTLGPVTDLERHLVADWWRTLFNELYLETDGDVFENERNTAAEVDLLIGAAGFDHDDRILDLCCGQGRHALELARRGFKDVTGLDRSRYLVRLARKRAKQAALKVLFHEGDARDIRFGDRAFDGAYILGNSFGYFERPEDDLAVLEAVKRALVPDGKFAIDVVDGDWMRRHFEPRSWEWVDRGHFVCRERSLAEDGDRLISREVVVDAERGVIADQFYAERLYSEARLETLLKRAGFSNLRVHRSLVAGSQRNQDLGMMANQLFVSCEALRRIKMCEVAGAARPKPHRLVVIPEVTVLLGDPRRPDVVRRNCRFNLEDIFGVERMKAALAELPEYRFRFLDDHCALHAELRANPPQFVLNFCDEGFNNDPFMELHVPALLETLGIPYSGAGPGCLGLCYDKSLVRGFAQSLGIPVPAESHLNSHDLPATIPFAFPSLIKPNFGDSSIGIDQGAVVHSRAEAVARLRRLRAQMPHTPLLIQEFLSGAEYSVGIIGNPGKSRHVLPVLEVDYSQLDPTLPRILAYDSKWDPQSPYGSQIAYRQAQLDDETRRRMIDHSIILFERLGCRDYARFDFRADAAGQVKLLEVNPNPGWYWDSKMNLMAGMAGLGYSALLGLIIEAARGRVAAPSPPPFVAQSARSVIRDGMPNRATG